MSGTVTSGSICSGYGGLDLAVEAFYGARTEWVCDNDSGAARILAHRFPLAPNLGDLTKVDWARVGRVDVVTAGWPCQPFSKAGRRRTEDDERAIWPEVARAISELRPRLVVLENVADIARADAAGRVELARVSRDLADLGFAVSWRLTLASEAGAPCKRARQFILAADPDQPRLEGRGAMPGSHQFDSGAHGLDASGRVSPPSWGCPACGGLDPECATCNLDLRVSHDWGEAWEAIERWANVIGWWPPAARDYRHQLGPRFAEWMMGLEPGWITDVPGITRKQAIRAAGNGVNPWQAMCALCHLDAAITEVL